MANPDLQIREGVCGDPDPEMGGGGGLKKFFQPLIPHFGPKIIGGC